MMMAKFPALAVLLACSVSATAATEKRLYLYGTPTGCLVQLAAPLVDKQSLRWDGACEREFAVGKGVLSIVDANGQLVSATEGAMQRGVLGEPASGGAAVAGAAAADDAKAPAAATKPTLVVYFEHGSSTLSAAAQSQLQEYYASLPANPKLRIKISGHSDASGSPRAREKVAQARAQSVRAYLGMQGLTNEQLIVASAAASPPQQAAAESRRAELEAWAEP